MANTILSVIALGSIMLTLLTMGMRIEQLSGSGSFQLPLRAVLIKMVAVPLIIGALLTATGFAGPERLILVLQAGMPCAFATLVLAENFNLDRAFTVQTHYQQSNIVVHITDLGSCINFVRPSINPCAIKQDS